MAGGLAHSVRWVGRMLLTLCLPLPSAGHPHSSSCMQGTHRGAEALHPPCPSPDEICSSLGSAGRCSADAASMGWALGRQRLQF